jgi:hypothetical protein
LLATWDFDLVKAALMPETMSEPHLGPMWDRSVKVWIAKVSQGNRWERGAVDVKEHFIQAA